MSNKKVSIITATFNCVSKNQKTFFYEMFRSIHEQDYPNIEHIIIDGGSKDGSVEFIQGLIKKYGKKEVVFISGKDRGINDATNKGYLKSSGDYITLMCDDDFYTRPYAVSTLVKTLEDNDADYSCADSWWLNKKCWGNDIDSFVYRHPFLINAFLFKRELISEPPYYLDEKYPMVADFDLFMRILSREDLKGASTDEILTILRPNGFSQSNNSQYADDVTKIYKKFFNSKIFTDKELLKLHYNRVNLFTYWKILLVCKNKNIMNSLKKRYNFTYVRRRFMLKVEYYLFFKFLYAPFRFRIKNKKKSSKYSNILSRQWIETFYDDLYSVEGVFVKNLSHKIAVEH